MLHSECIDVIYTLRDYTVIQYVSCAVFLSYYVGAGGGILFSIQALSSLLLLVRGLHGADIWSNHAKQ